MSDVQKVKERIDIVELIQEYIQLKQSGTNWKGLCPFHHEKSPSFMASKDKQIWHCFGCDRGGDAFAFMQEMDGIEFGEALRVLAKRAGVELTNSYSPKNASKKQQLHDIVAAAQQLYSHTLNTHPSAEPVRKYVQGRGISPETSAQFGLGYSLDSWDSLYHFLRSKKYSDAAIEAAGLSIRRSNGKGYYDRFRNRLMIPLHDYNGTVVGFTARTMDPEFDGGKYINSPQSMVYDKSRLLYGLYFSKNGIKRLKATIVVEGNIDVITAHQAGFPNVVATSGTAFTDEQITLLKRYSSNVLLAFDMDGAGVQAAQRSIATALQHGMNVKVIQLPEQFKDPDECIQKDPAAFTQAIREALNIIDFYFQSVTKPLDLSRVEHKKKAVEQLLPVLQMLNDPIERSHYLQKLSDMVHIPLDIISKQFQELPASKQPPRIQPVQASTRPEPAKPVAKSTAPERYNALSQFIVGMVFAYPDQAGYIIETVESAYLTDPSAQELYNDVRSYYNKGRNFSEAAFRAEYPHYGSQIDTLQLFVPTFLNTTSEVDTAEQGRNQLITAVKQLHKYYIQRQIQAIEFKLKEAEHIGSSEQVEGLLRQLNTLTHQLRDLSA